MKNGFGLKFLIFLHSSDFLFFLPQLLVFSKSFMPQKYKANMRCYISDKDETVTEPSGLTIWSSNLQNPSILETLENINRIESISCSDTLSTLYTLDTVSQSYKRKLLECEKEDFEDRFSKIQKKHQMLRTKASFIEVDDDDDDDFDDEIYEQMEWLKDESSAMTLHLWKDKDVDLSIQSINSSTPIMYLPKLNWREERRRLLHISMAKIRGVEDPETYLRRSVLINNTVRRLQKDVAITYRSQPLLSSSVGHEDTTSDNKCNNYSIENSMDGIHSYKHDCFQGNNIQCKHVANDPSTNNHINLDVETVTPYGFHMSVITPFSSDKCVNFQNEILQNSIFSKGLIDSQTGCDPSLHCRAFKQVNSVVYSSQPCGLQYRSTSHEDTNRDYSESNSSSLLDSVVYHSLIASLET